MPGQPGFFDLDERYAALSAAGDPLMFKLLVLQTLYTLSDDQTEYQLRDRLSFMRFAGLALEDRAPDAKPLWLFRDQLTRAIERLFARFDHVLREAGYFAMGGQIVDAILIQARRPRLTRSEKATIKGGGVPSSWSPAKRAQMHTEGRWTRKRGRKRSAEPSEPHERTRSELVTPVFNHKNHLGIDRRHGFIRSFVVIDAAHHDGRPLGRLLDPHNTASGLWADTAYRSAANVALLARRGLFAALHSHMPRYGSSYRGEKLPSWHISHPCIHTTRRREASCTAIMRNMALRYFASIIALTIFCSFFGTAHAADDTFSCFDHFTGPVIKTFSGDQGYANYSAPSDLYNGNWTSGSRIDARGSTWRQEHLAGGGTKPLNPWLVILGGNWKHPPKSPLCWAGGRFIGSTPMSFGYNETKRNAGEAIQFNSDGGIIEGVRIHNIHEDGIGVTGDTTSRRPHKPTTIKDTWISHNHANAIENDRIKNLIVEDVLIDRSFHPISVDPGSTYNGNNEEHNNTIVISNTLIRNKYTENTEFDGRLKYNNFIKTRHPSPSPKFKVYNTIFAAEGWPDTYTISSGPPAREKLFRDNIVDCKNNLLLWLPDSPVPPPNVFPLEPKHCFKLVTGKAARDLWAAAKQNWINCHPKAERTSGDPASNPSKCDPNAYGGGGSATPWGGSAG